MTSITLSQDEIQQITGRCRYTAQSRQLAKMGIEHRLNAAGEPIVSRQHFERVMGAGVGSSGDCGVELHLDFVG